MNYRPLLIMLALMTLVVGIAITGPHQMPAQAQESTVVPTSGHALVGTWIVDDPNDLADTPSLTVLTEGGIVLDVTAAASTGAGSWRATGPKSGVATFIYLNQDSSGRFTSSVIIRADAQIGDDPDTFTASYSLTLVAADGTVIDTRFGEVQGHRVPIEPVEAGGTPLTVMPVVASPVGTPGS